MVNNVECVDQNKEEVPSKSNFLWINDKTSNVDSHSLSVNYSTTLQEIEAQIYFRPLEVGDKEEIKALHEEWFPVKYSDEYYDAVVHNETIDGNLIYSCAASLVSNDVEKSVQSNTGGKTAWDRLSASLGIDKLYNGNHSRLNFPITVQKSQQSKDWKRNSEPILQQRNGELDTKDFKVKSRKDAIVGCIVGAFKYNSCSNKRTVSTLIRNPEHHTRMFYIMTLGTVEEFRNCGLATKMIENCVKLVEKVPTCGALYLHVITHNSTAIRFYEKMGFCRVQEIEDYYRIDGINHNCYLYARFFHGNRRPILLFLYSIWKRFISSIFSDESKQLKNC